MANTTILKRRIGSVKNTKQITKAMELVAASKMRRAQEAALKSREFRNQARAILTRLRELTDVNHHPIFNQRAIKSQLFIVVTSDRGLAGAYNSNVFKELLAQINLSTSSGASCKLIALGKQGAKFAARLKDIEIVAVYNEIPDHPTSDDLKPLIDSVIKMQISKECDAVDVIFTDFISSIRQIVKTQRLLPAAFTDVEIEPSLEGAIFEPNPRAVLDNIAERLVEVQLWQNVLEAVASEHSARMLAMKNATDNANELIDDLTLEFNSARQASITQELAEITGGAEAMK